ncbi:hypothetical protein NK8_70250 (plasmid) [Caballeronia sp. NK8]|nr:hypothetical protein NK8_70250 [Caballeronia sp. NK8]
MPSYNEIQEEECAAAVARELFAAAQFSGKDGWAEATNYRLAPLRHLAGRIKGMEAPKP